MQFCQRTALFLFWNLICLVSAPFAEETPGDQAWYQPDAVAVYVGAGSEEKFKPSLAFKFESAHETMYAAELDWHLTEQNFFNRMAGYIGAEIEPAVLIAYRDDRIQDEGIEEIVLFAHIRWSKFPWNHKLMTTIAIGEGVSYTNGLTTNELIDAADADEDEGPQRWLNFISLELTAALPAHPQWQVFYRLHHRSGAFGLFAANDVGSNVMGLGVRYMFANPGRGASIN